MLEVKLGATVTLVIDGHSQINGAVIPDGSTVVITSNDPAVATIAAVTVPAGGSQELIAAVTILATGTTDAHVTVTAPDGTVFEATDTLVVDPVAQPGLVRISVTFTAA